MQITEQKEIDNKIAAVKLYIDNIKDQNVYFLKQAVTELIDTSQTNLEQVKAVWIARVQEKARKKLEVEL